MSELNESQIKKLIRASCEMKEKSYCRYSKFRVGAALMTSDGTIITGCNVENASYPLCICAERTAIVKAVSEGHRKFKALAIASDLNTEFITPCGACRQTIIEFALDCDVYMTKPDMTYEVMKAKDLIPKSFGPTALEQEQEHV